MKADKHNIPYTQPLNTVCRCNEISDIDIIGCPCYRCFIHNRQMNAMEVLGSHAYILLMGILRYCYIFGVLFNKL